VNTVDTWIRDYGPIFVRDGKKKAFTKWIFNAWGGKYADLARDNGVVDKLSALKKVRRINTGVILEGGSIDMNGRGTCLTSEQCLLNPNRNPHLSRRAIEALLGKYLGVTNTIWLREGIEGDDTDGHIDDITRFVNPTTVLTAMESNKLDKNHWILKDNFEVLKRSKDQNGRKLNVVELPMPGRLGPARPDTPHHKRLPASYANFYIGNAAVLVPVYSHRNDAKALRIVKRFFPGRKVIGIECSDLVYGLGSIHCVTQQEPA
jgi:agmatine deiminase